MKFFTKTKKISVIILSAAILATTPISALAAEITPASIAINSEANDDTGATPYSGIRTYQIGSDYKTIPASFGVNGGMFSVIVENFAPNDYQMDISMNGRNGLLWHEEDCLHNSSNRAFECSSEVRSISLRIIPRNRLLFPAQPKSFTVKASW